METEINPDISEEIIFKLKQIIAKLDRIIQDEKKCTDTLTC